MAFAASTALSVIGYDLARGVKQLAGQRNNMIRGIKGLDGQVDDAIRGVTKQTDNVLKKAGRQGNGALENVVPGKQAGDMSHETPNKGFPSGQSESNSSSSNAYIPMNADGNPIQLRKQNANSQDILLPDLNASGPHTVISSKTGEVYRRSATFPEGTWPTANGQNVPWSEVHWTDHSTPHHHTNPHQHIFEYNPDKGGWIREALI